MERVLEPEIMDGEAQAIAYARAGFADVNARFVRDALARHPDLAAGLVIDLGCGPADVPLRLASAAPRARVVAVDASLPMLRLARDAATGRPVRLVRARVPALPFPAGIADGVIANSLVHHLPDPRAFWRAARDLVRPGGALHVMDLFRPDSAARARAIVEAAAPTAEPVLREDFYRSLLAALSPAEVHADLAAAGLGHLRCEVVSERHWLVSGRR